MILSFWRIIQDVRFYIFQMFVIQLEFFAFINLNILLYIIIKFTDCLVFNNFKNVILKKTSWIIINFIMSWIVILEFYLFVDIWWFFIYWIVSYLSPIFLELSSFYWFLMQIIIITIIIDQLFKYLLLILKRLFPL